MQGRTHKSRTEERKEETGTLHVCMNKVNNKMEKEKPNSVIETKVQTSTKQENKTGSQGQKKITFVYMKQINKMEKGKPSSLIEAKVQRNTKQESVEYRQVQDKF